LSVSITASGITKQDCNCRQQCAARVPPPQNQMYHETLTTGGDNITPQDKTKSNTTKASMHAASLTKNTYNIKSTQKELIKPGLVASYNIRPGNGMGQFQRSERNLA